MQNAPGSKISFGHFWPKQFSYSQARGWAKQLALRSQSMEAMIESFRGITRGASQSPHTLTIRFDAEVDRVMIIDQTRLPHECVEVELKTSADACHAISSMQVRGAPLIGVTAAFGVYLGLRGKDDETARSLSAPVIEALAATRPTAINLGWALDKIETRLARCHRSSVRSLARSSSRASPIPPPRTRRARKPFL